MFQALGPHTRWALGGHKDPPTMRSLLSVWVCVTIIYVSLYVGVLTVHNLVHNNPLKNLFIQNNFNMYTIYIEISFEVIQRGNLEAHAIHPSLTEVYTQLFAQCFQPIGMHLSSRVSYTRDLTSQNYVNHM